MNSTDHDLKDLIDRHLKWQSDLSFTAARDRVRDQLLATPAWLLTARVADAPGCEASAVPTSADGGATACLVVSGGTRTWDL